MLDLEKTDRQIMLLTNFGKFRSSQSYSDWGHLWTVLSVACIVDVISKIINSYFFGLAVNMQWRKYESKQNISLSIFLSAKACDLRG